MLVLSSRCCTCPSFCACWSFPSILPWLCAIIPATATCISDLKCSCTSSSLFSLCCALYALILDWLDFSKLSRLFLRRVCSSHSIWLLELLELVLTRTSSKSTSPEKLIAKFSFISSIEEDIFLNGFP